MGFGCLIPRPLKDATSVRILCSGYHSNCYEDHIIALCGLFAGGSSLTPSPDRMTQSHNEEDSRSVA